MTPAEVMANTRAEPKPPLRRSKYVQLRLKPKRKPGSPHLTTKTLLGRRRTKPLNLDRHTELRKDHLVLVSPSQEAVRNDPAHRLLDARRPRGNTTR